MNEQEKRIYDLSVALFLLSLYYEGDTGGEAYMDRTREYLAQFEIGKQVLREYDEHILHSIIFDGEVKDA